MKNILTRLWIGVLLLATSGQLHAQTVLTPGISPVNNLWQRSARTQTGSGLGKTSTCGADTVNYVWNKTSALATITLNSTTSGNAFAQWYPCPQALSVAGFEFYAWQIASSSAIVPITCRIYNAGLDSMPSGTPLASVTVNVDSTFGSGTLTTLRKLAIFSSPVAVSSSNGFVITLETSSSVSVAVVANSWTASPPNGQTEWLSSVRIGTTYYRSYNINVGGIPFNADFIIQPFVSYNLTANFTSSMNCMSVGTPANFTNTSSPVLFSRFYNVRAFFNNTQYSCLWDFGDSTGQYYSINPTRTYNYNATYKIQLSDTLYGWTRNCSDYAFRFINQIPVLSSASNNGPVCAGGSLRLNTDSIPGATYAWGGPNSFSSSVRNPVITPASANAAGVYYVQATLSGCTSTAISTTASIVSSYNASNNSPLCAGQNLSLNATQLNGATYSWTGPNGFSSTLYNPTRLSVSKADSGVYSVTITTQGCGVIGPLTTLVIVNNIPATPVAGSNAPVCLGSNLNLTASGTSGSYFWSGPGGYTSNIQNPIRLSATAAYAGTYTVIVTENGCSSAPASTNVVVNSIPAAPTAGNNGPLCSGQSLSLTATLIPGASYTWSGPNNFSSALQNPGKSSITLADAGTYSVYATVGGCASSVATTSVSISSNTPSPTVSGNGPLCPGQNLQLTASSIAGATYSWTGPKNFSSTLQNPVINNVNDSNAGLYSVTATTSACGTSNAATYNLVVNTLPPAPALSNNGPVCEGQNLNLFASTITGATYTWTGPGGFSSNSQNPTISNMSKLKAGVYSAYVNVSGCGTSASANTNVVVYAKPANPAASSNSPVCVGDTIKLNASASGTGPNASFSWSGPNGFSANTGSVFISSALATDAGTYAVQVTDSGCTSNASSLNIQVRSNPSAPTASSNSPVCKGSALQLQAAGVSGASYQWQGPGGFSSDLQNTSINSTDSSHAGTYSVRAIVSGCKSVPASIIVVINPLPAAPVATNTGPGCEGGNIQLRASTINGASYTWSGPAFSSTQQNPSLNGITKSMAGDYSVSATLNGCTSPASITTLVINSVPAAPSLSSNPAGSVCTGDSLRFYAANVTDGEFSWSGPLGFSSTLQNPVLYISATAQSGIYEARVSRMGCESAKSTLTIQANLTPATSPINGAAVVKRTESQNYSVTANTGSTYNWTVSGGTIQSGNGTSSITVIWNIIGTGSVKVTETSSASCKGVAQVLDVTVNPANGIEETMYNSGINLYPNPGNGQIHISSQRVLHEIKVTDLSGREIYSDNALTGNKEADLNLGNLSKGYYLIHLSTETGNVCLRYLKQD